MQYPSPASAILWFCLLHCRCGSTCWCVRTHGLVFWQITGWSITFWPTSVWSLRSCCIRMVPWCLGWCTTLYRLWFCRLNPRWRKWTARCWMRQMILAQTAWNGFVRSRFPYHCPVWYPGLRLCFCHQCPALSFPSWWVAAATWWLEMSLKISLLR